MTENHKDTKRIWTEKDFNEMGWHDSRIFSIKFPEDDFMLCFDISYIFEWVWNGNEIKGFWVSRCRLCFEHVSDMEFKLDFEMSQALDILDITRGPEHRNPGAELGTREYTISCNEGFMRFRASGYQQEVLNPPAFSKTQDLSVPL